MPKAFGCRTFDPPDPGGFDLTTHVNVFQCQWDCLPAEKGDASRFTVVSRSVAGGIGIVKVWGEMDILNAPRVRVEIGRRLECGAVYLGVNLAKVRYLDSTGLRTLIEGLQSARARGGTLVLISPSDLIVRLLRVTGLCSLFEVYQEEAAVIRRFAG